MQISNHRVAAGTRVSRCYGPLHTRGTVESVDRLTVASAFGPALRPANRCRICPSTSLPGRLPVVLPDWSSRFPSCPPLTFDFTCSPGGIRGAISFGYPCIDGGLSRHLHFHPRALLHRKEGVWLASTVAVPNWSPRTRTMDIENVNAAAIKSPVIIRRY
jgi:hypothetical protein